MREPNTESIVRLALLVLALILVLYGRWLNWRGYLQGMGCGMCIVLLIWDMFAFYRFCVDNHKFKDMYRR